MRIVCRETLVHRFDQLGIDFALADKCACRFLSFRKKGGAVLEAVLCMAAGRIDAGRREDSHMAVMEISRTFLDASPAVPLSTQKPMKTQS